MSMDDLVAMALEKRKATAPAQGGAGPVNPTASAQAPAAESAEAPKEEKSLVDKAVGTVENFSQNANDLMKAPVRGALSGTGKTMDFIAGVGNFIEKATGIQDMASSIGLTTEEGFFYDQREGASGVGRYEELSTKAFDYYLGQSETRAGQLVEGISEFLVPLGPGAKVVTKAGKVLSKFMSPSVVKKMEGLTRTMSYTKNAAAGAIADNVIFDEADKNLSNLLEETMPGMKDSILTSLAIDEDDSAFEKRMKITLEGAGLGVLADLMLDARTFYKSAKKIGDEAGTFQKNVTVDIDGEAVDINLNPGNPRSLYTRLKEDIKTIPNFRQSDLALLDEYSIKKLIDTNDNAKAYLKGSPEVTMESFAKDLQEIIETKKVRSREGLARFKKIKEWQALPPKERFEAINGGQLEGVRAAGKTAHNWAELKEYVNGDVNIDRLKEIHGENSIEVVAYEAQTLAALEENLRNASNKYIAEGGRNADIYTQMEFQDALEIRNEQYANLFNGEIANAGKVLNYTKELYKDLDAVRFKNITDNYSKNLNPNHLDQLEKIAEVAGKLDKEAKEFAKASGFDVYADFLHDTVIANYLSSPKTHALNMTSNFTTIFMDSLAEALSIPFKKGDVDKAASKAYLKALVDRKNVSRAWNHAKYTFATGNQSALISSSSKLNQPRINAAEELARSAEANNNSFLQGLFGAASQVQRKTFGALQSADSFAKSMLLDANMTKKYVEKALDGMSSAQIKKEMDNFSVKKWDQMDQGVLAQSMDESLAEADKLLLTTENPENIGGAFLNWLSESPGYRYTKVFVPFARVGVNQATLIAQTTPGLHLLTNTHKVIEAGGPAAIKAKTRLWLGGATMLTGVALEQSGIIQGPHSRDSRVAAEQRKFNKEYSINGIELRMFGPAGAQLIASSILSRLVSSAVDYMESETPDDYSMVDELQAATSMMMSELIIPTQFSQSLPEFFTAVSSLDEGGKQADLSKYLTRLSTNTIPFKGQASWVDKFYNKVFEEGTLDYRGVENEFVKEITRALPSLGRVIGLRPSVTIFGDDQDQSLTPAQETRNADIWVEMEKIGFNYLSAPSDGNLTSPFFVAPQRKVSFDGTEVDLNHDEYYTYQKYVAGLDETGKALPGLQGVSMADALRKEIKSGYKSAIGYGLNQEPSDEAKRLVIRQIKQRYTDYGRELFKSKLSKDPEFRTKLEDEVKNYQGRLKPKFKN